MEKERLLQFKDRLSNLSEREEKERNLYLKKVANGEILGPMTGYASIDKPWLKYYSDSQIQKNKKINKTIYRYIVDANKDNMNLTAINFYGFKKNYREFFKNINATANSLTKLGVKDGDVVTICSPTFPETVYLNLALNKIGAIANNIDPRNNASRIRDNINKVKSDYVFVLDIASPKIDAIISETDIKKVITISYGDSIPMFAKPVFMSKLKKTLASKGLSIPEINYGDKYITWKNFIKLGRGTISFESGYKENAPVAMVMTGGTTGPAKSVVLTNDSALAVVENYKATDLGLETGQSLLNFMPEFIAYGWTFGIVMASSLGIENIIIPQFDQNEFADYILKYKPNHLVGVPTHYTALIEDDRMKDVDFSKFLLSVSAGGDHFSEKAEHRFNEFLHEHNYSKNVIVGYGLTEANSSIATRLNKKNSVGCAGIPLINNNISIFRFPSGDEKYTEEELTYGEFGEIAINCPSAMLGYYNDPENTNQVQFVHSDGSLWTHTKDNGYITLDGELYVNGRLKRMIIRPDGHNVWPLEMEKVISMHEDVESCCVVGIPSETNTQGEYPYALVVLKDTCKKTPEVIREELHRLALDNLPERDIPYGYVFDKELPLTGVGKVDFQSVKKRILKK